MTDSTDGLAALRDDIDRIDDDIADLVAERIETAEEIAAAKSSEGRDLVDEEREETVKSRYAERSSDTNWTRKRAARSRSS